MSRPILRLMSEEEIYAAGRLRGIFWFGICLFALVFAVLFLRSLQEDAKHGVHKGVSKVTEGRLITSR